MKERKAENKSIGTGQARAVGLFLLRKYKEAGAVYDDLLKREPDNMIFQINKLICEYHYSSDRKAVFDKLMSKGDDLPAQGYLCLADISIKDQRPDDALGFLDKALEKEDDNIEAYLSKAFLLNNLDRQEELYALVRSVYPRFQKDERILCLAAFYASLFQNMQQADYLLKKAVETNRKAAIQDRFLYLALLNMDGKEKLAEFSQEALLCWNRNPVVWHALSQAYMEMNEYQLANEMFDGLSRLEELSDDLKLQWMTALLEKGDYEAAFDKLCRLRTVSEESLWLAGDFFNRLAQEERSDEIVEKAGILEKRYGDSPDIAFVCDVILDRNRRKAVPLLSIRAENDRLAENLRDFSFGSSYLAPVLLKQALEHCSLPFEGSLDVLDLGCGTGAMAPLLSKYSNEHGTLTGVDISPAVLAFAQEQQGYTQLWETDIVSFCKTERKDKQYDIIAGINVFSSFADLSEVFQAVSQALKPNGVFVFSVFPSEERSFVFRSGLFYHNAGYVSSLLKRYSLTEEYQQEDTLYDDKESDGTSLIFVARKKA